MRASQDTHLSPATFRVRLFFVSLPIFWLSVIDGHFTWTYLYFPLFHCAPFLILPWTFWLYSLYPLPSFLFPHGLLLYSCHSSSLCCTVKSDLSQLFRFHQKVAFFLGWTAHDTTTLKKVGKRHTQSVTLLKYS